MKLVKTDDGSYTYYNEEFEEHYHTKSGAIEEAFEKHVNAVGVSDGMKILDFCFDRFYCNVRRFGCGRHKPASRNKYQSLVIPIPRYDYRSRHTCSCGLTV